MIIDILKLLGSIVLGTGIAFIFAAKANRLAKTKITAIPYTSEYQKNMKIIKKKMVVYMKRLLPVM